MNETGQKAASPWRMGWPAFKAIALRSWKEAGDDNIGLVAAGVAFYGFLALVPLLGALVLSYGLVATPDTVMKNINGLAAAMPADAAKLIGEQLMNVVKSSDGKKGFGLLLALALALFGARNGAGAIVTALNIVYEEKEKRGFIRLNLLALGITASGVVVALFAMVAIGALGALEELIPGAPDVVVVLGKILSYALLTLAGAGGAATLYRYGPSRQKARWTWLTPGSLLAAVLWLALTLGFGIYASNFGNYNATYGSLSAVVVLLTWLYLSSYVLLFGAELNSEFEHETEQDTTDGVPVPIGERGAWVADHVATGDETANNPASDPLKTRPSSAPPPARPSVAADYLASRAAARAGTMAGGKRIGMVSSALATAGLTLVRGRRRALPGLALLASAAGLAWLLGAPEDPQDNA